MTKGRRNQGAPNRRQLHPSDNQADLDQWTSGAFRRNVRGRCAPVPPRNPGELPRRPRRFRLGGRRFGNRVATLQISTFRRGLPGTTRGMFVAKFSVDLLSDGFYNSCQRQVLRMIRRVQIADEFKGSRVRRSARMKPGKTDRKRGEAAVTPLESIWASPALLALAGVSVSPRPPRNASGLVPVLPLAR